MNIFCVGRNYRLHAQELGNAVPSAPMFFSKPTHALRHMEGQTLELPGNRGELHYEAELVVRVAKTYEPGIAAGDLFDGIALGIDWTLRDLQAELKRKGLPWLEAKGFRGAAWITGFRPFDAAAFASRPFELRVNGEVRQAGDPADMVFDLAQLAAFCGQMYGLGPGDLIYTGTPEGVAAVNDGDRLELLWGGETLGAATASLKR